MKTACQHLKKLNQEDEEAINSKKWEYYNINSKEEAIAWGNKNNENIFNLEMFNLI